MARTITLKYDATCRDCGTQLYAGERARYYGRGRVYGVECHEQRPHRRTGRTGMAQAERAERAEAAGYTNHSS